MRCTPLDTLDASQQERSGIEMLREWIKQLIKHPREVGAIAPSSTYLSKRMTPTDVIQAADVIVELGPGMGSFTEEIVHKMSKDATLVLIETNPTFIDFLTERYERDERVIIVPANAANLQKTLQTLGIAEVDVVISGLPFASLGTRQTESILQEVKAVLSDTGLFLTFQYTKVRQLHFEHVFHRVRYEREFRNLPPAYLFHCTM